MNEDERRINAEIEKLRAEFRDMERRLEGIDRVARSVVLRMQEFEQRMRSSEDFVQAFKGFLSSRLTVGGHTLPGPSPVQRAPAPTPAPSPRPPARIPPDRKPPVAPTPPREIPVMREIEELLLTEALQTTAYISLHGDLGRPKEGVLKVNGKAVPISSTDFLLLYLLCSHRKRAISTKAKPYLTTEELRSAMQTIKESIAERPSGAEGKSRDGRQDEEDLKMLTVESVRRSVCDLRADTKGLIPGDPEWIETAGSRGKGYRLSTLAAHVDLLVTVAPGLQRTIDGLALWNAPREEVDDDAPDERETSGRG